MPTEYTLSELSKLTGVSARTVRYYIQSGLLPAPVGAGPAARYTEAHIDRLRFIRKLQSAHLPLNEIRRRLEALPEDWNLAVADAAADYAPADSALDYISTVLGRDNQPAVTLPVQPNLAASYSLPAPASEPDRAQWERISLDPDIEIHVRRPLSRLQNKRVERLISIARQLLEED